MEVSAIVEAVYEIQGCADPDDSPATLKERMDRIYGIACDVMKRTRFQPED